jgi:hypothetical protein
VRVSRPSDVPGSFPNLCLLRQVGRCDGGVEQLRHGGGDIAFVVTEKNNPGDAQFCMFVLI